MNRTGCIYFEMTNKGRCSTRYVRGAKPIYTFRWVGEMTVQGKRFRLRSNSLRKVEAWIEDMRRKYEGLPCHDGRWKTSKRISI